MQRDLSRSDARGLRDELPARQFLAEVVEAAVTALRVCPSSGSCAILAVGHSRADLALCCTPDGSALPHYRVCLPLGTGTDLVPQQVIAYDGVRISANWKPAAVQRGSDSGAAHEELRESTQAGRGTEHAAKSAMAAAAGAGAAAVAPSAGASSSGNTPKAGGGGAASAYTSPRRRVSYLIPPPPGDAPPPFLSLPAPEDIKHAKKGNPNPLIVLSTAQAGQAGAANDDGDGDDGLFPTSSPARRGRGESYSSSNGRYSQGDASSPPLMFGSPGGRSNTSHNPPSFPGASQRGFGKPLQQSRSSRPARPTQWHPEHTLGVSALALDTSTVIDSSSSGSGRRPAGILYSGGRDGLVASWELGLPLQRRDPTAGYVGTHAGGRYESSASGRGRGQPGSSVQAFAGTPRPRRYRPRWAEDAYDSDSSDSSREGSRESSGRSDTHGEGRHDDFDEDGGSSSSREGGSSEEDVRAFGGAAYQSSPRLRLDTTFTDDNDALYPLHGSNKRGGRASNGLRLDMSSSSAKRQGSKLGSSGRRSTLIDQRLPYEDRWCIDERLLNEYVRLPLKIRRVSRLRLNPCASRSRLARLSGRPTADILTGSTTSSYATSIKRSSRRPRIA